MNNIKNRIIIALIVFLSSLTCLFLVLIYLEKTNVNSNLTTKNTVQEETGETKKEKTYPSDLTGKILFSSEQDEPGLYSYDIKSKKINLLISDLNSKYLDAKSSPDQSRIVFSKISSNEDHNENQLIILDNENENIIKSGVTTRKPQWSPDGKKIVYQSIESKRDAEYSLESWNIYLKDLSLSSSEKEEYITNGYSPIFISDEKILVAKNDGIYLVDLINPSEKSFLIYEFKTNQTDPRIAVSSNFKYLAFSEEDSVYVLEIDNWESDFNKFKNQKVVNAYAKEIIFSPDNQNIILTKNDLKQRKLFIYDLKNFSKVSEINFDNLNILVTDWKN